jgi:hypothetical protein
MAGRTASIFGFGLWKERSWSRAFSEDILTLSTEHENSVYKSFLSAILNIVLHGIDTTLALSHFLAYAGTPLQVSVPGSIGSEPNSEWRSIALTYHQTRPQCIEMDSVVPSGTSYLG